MPLLHVKMWVLWPSYESIWQTSFKFSNVNLFNAFSLCLFGSFGRWGRVVGSWATRPTSTAFLPKSPSTQTTIQNTNSAQGLKLELCVIYEWIFSWTYRDCPLHVRLENLVDWHRDDDQTELLLKCSKLKCQGNGRNCVGETWWECGD